MSFSLSTRTLIINDNLYARCFNEIEIGCIYSAVEIAIRQRSPRYRGSTEELDSN